MKTWVRQRDYVPAAPAAIIIQYVEVCNMARRTAPVGYVVGKPTLACEKMGEISENRVVSIPGARSSPADHPHRCVPLAKVVVVVIVLVMGHEELLS